MSDYQAAWIEAFEPEEVDWETESEDDAVDLSINDEKDDPMSDREKDFEDEVETPQTIGARFRFLK